MKTVNATLAMALILGLLVSSGFSQSSLKITLLHNGTSQFYPVLNTAIDSAKNGDTIILPGGAVQNNPPLNISKRLTIVGAGHYPDSTSATRPTTISNGFYILPGADSGSISGISGLGISIGNGSANSANVANYRIERNYLNSLTINNGTGHPINLRIIENVIPFQVQGSDTAIFEKNIFTGNACYGSGYNGPAYFNNNVFYSCGGCGWGLPAFPWGNNSMFVNNIFIWRGGVGSYPGWGLGSNCLYVNNLFCSVTPLNSGTFQCGQTNTCENNIIDQLISDTFVNANTSLFVYSNDYHLKPTSPGKNASLDGTDVGIYGTSIPYKEGAVPFNPHISLINVGVQVSPSGSLPVEFKVSAQDH